MTVLLSACETMAPTPSRTSGPVTTELRSDAEYLSYLRVLSTAGSSTQKALYEQVTREYQEQSNRHTRLRLALALSQLGAPYGNPSKARQLFKALLTPEQSLSPGLETIVLVQINDLNLRITQEARLSQLQQELDEAKSKIQALTTIEKTLEQPIPETKTKVTP